MHRRAKAVRKCMMKRPTIHACRSPYRRQRGAAVSQQNVKAGNENRVRRRWKGGSKQAHALVAEREDDSKRLRSIGTHTPFLQVRMLAAASCCSAISFFPLILPPRYRMASSSMMSTSAASIDACRMKTTGVLKLECGDSSAGRAADG